MKVNYTFNLGNLSICWYYLQKDGCRQLSLQCKRYKKAQPVTEGLKPVSKLLTKTIDNF